MRARSFPLFVALATLAVSAPTASAQDADRSVKGGLQVPGWKARIDRRAMSQGKTVNDSKMVAEGNALRLSVGPAGNFWKPEHMAKGDFEIMGTFKEHKMAASHPHSYGIFIGGNDLESATETLLYCIVYGNGTYSIKSFHGEKVTTYVNMEASPALKKADGDGVATNSVSWRVKDGKASCVLNGTVAKTLDATQYAGPDKMKTLDGNYGLRVSHNVELTVSGFMKH
ncbi:MAG: hypothetical protein ACKVS7_07070 [Gemmatimonadaceae bacterium]